tara:strand:- start:583 stop:807 length:225 start_codon:yes stop_codon:yes gene_type:complete
MTTRTARAFALIFAGLAALFLSSCSFNDQDNPPLAGASAVIGQRNVLGAEVNLFGWRRVGAGLWIQPPAPIASE